MRRWSAVVGAALVIAICAGASGVAGASAAGAGRRAPAAGQRLFSVTASGSQHIDWTFAWKATGTPVPNVTCVWKWSGSGSQSLTFTTTKQRTLLQVFSGHPTVVAFTPQQRRKPWVTGKQDGEGEADETIRGPSRYCGMPTTYSRKDCGKSLTRSAPAVQLFYLANDRGVYTKHVGITVPDIGSNELYSCPFLDTDGGELMVLQDVVPVNIYTMSFKDSISTLLGLKRGHSQSFHGTTILQAIKGWEKSWCNLPKNTLPGSGSCTVKGTVNWRIRLLRIK